MELSDLRVFVAVAQEGGISRAAAVLHRVPSNITTRIQNLEADLGVPLFIREGKRLRLSAQGKVLLDYAHRLLDLAEEARSALSDLVPRGVLKLGAMESTAAIRFPGMLAELQRRYPEIMVELRTGAPRPLTARVLAGELDAALIAEPVSDPRLSHTLAYCEPLVLIGPPGHPPILHPRDIQTGSLLVFEPDCPHRQRLEAWCSHGGVAPSRVIELGSYHAMLGCCVAGMGIALIPAAVLDIYSERAHLSEHALRGAMRSVNTVLVWRQDSMQAKVGALVELFKDIHAQ
ncbi:MAG: LysR family transcriptional regulator [Burkholderiales bacterium]|nr:LysR family transcriptional regulator [Burkholderiales bacterium]